MPSSAVVRRFAIMLAIAGQSACAPVSPARSLAELPRLVERGAAVRVTETTGRAMEGKLDRVSAISLAILIDNRPLEIAHTDVVRVDRTERPIGRGALIGLAVGLGAGLIAARSERSSGSPLVDTEAASGTAIGSAALGAALGAIVGSMVKAHRTVYLAPAGSHQTAAPVNPSR